MHSYLGHEDLFQLASTFFFWGGGGVVLSTDRTFYFLKYQKEISSQSCFSYIDKNEIRIDCFNLVLLWQFLLKAPGLGYCCLCSSKGARKPSQLYNAKFGLCFI